MYYNVPYNYISHVGKERERNVNKIGVCPVQTAKGYYVQTFNGNNIAVHTNTQPLLACQDELSPFVQRQWPTELVRWGF